MKNNEIHKTVQSDFLKNVSEILLQARKNAKTAVNLSMVYAYYEIGRMIVEEEQHGANRAAYGKQLLKELSAYLTDIFGKGFSTTNLKQMRQFYLTYVNDQISQTLSDQFETLPTASKPYPGGQTAFVVFPPVRDVLLPGTGRFSKGHKAA